jgi:hypothetical protein
MSGMSCALRFLTARDVPLPQVAEFLRAAYWSLNHRTARSRAVSGNKASRIWAELRGDERREAREALALAGVPASRLHLNTCEVAKQ